MRVSRTEESVKYEISTTYNLIKTVAVMDKQRWEAWNRAWKSVKRRWDIAMESTEKERENKNSKRIVGEGRVLFVLFAYAGFPEIEFIILIYEGV